MSRPPLTFYLSFLSIASVQAFHPNYRLHLTPSQTTHIMSGATDAAAPACGLGAKGRCVPCESLDKSHVLSQDAVEKELAESLNMWKLKPLDGGANGKGDDDQQQQQQQQQQHSISRSFTARNFQAALDAVNAIGAIAERENHHPDLHLTGYRNVEIVLYTHSLGGLSINDIELAKEIDTVDVQYSPKWLKSHPEAKRE